MRIGNWIRCAAQLETCNDHDANGDGMMVENRLEIVDIKHALVAIDLRDSEQDESNILQVIGYADPISDEEIEALYQELATDPEHGMTDLVPYKDYMLTRQTADDIRELMEIEDLLDKQDELQ